MLEEWSVPDDERDAAAGKHDANGETRNALVSQRVDDGKDRRQDQYAT